MQETRTTNWVAIIGAPSAGKSSVIEELEHRGYAVAHEVARAYMQERLATGETLDAIRGSAGIARMQQDIFARTVERDDKLDPQALIFFDRGIGDTLFYFRRAGLDPAAPRAQALRLRYRAVFLLDRLPVTPDSIRTEDDAAAQQMQDAFLADYAALGYSVKIVPVMPIAARADFILRELGLPALSSTQAMA